MIVFVAILLAAITVLMIILLVALFKVSSYGEDEDYMALRIQQQTEKGLENRDGNNKGTQEDDPDHD